MQLPRTGSVTAVVLSLSILLILLSSTTEAHNIRRILARHPEFSTFNHYLNLTQLAPEINSREGITVCAVSNSGMEDFLLNHTIDEIKDALSLHVLLGYYSSKMLHQLPNGLTLVSTMYEDTVGSPKFLTITQLKSGKVHFSPENSTNVSATFLKNVYQLPYSISVIQISSILRL